MRGGPKYCHHVDHRPQSFDVVADPLECTDLAEDLEYDLAKQELHEELRRILAPVAIDRQAKAEQRAARARQ